MRNYVLTTDLEKMYRQISVRLDNRFLSSEKNRSKIRSCTSDRNVGWYFIPARSPRFVGLWKAAVKSFKHHFYRIASTTIFSYEALHTLTVEIEAILNSRPLSPLSSNPNELQAPAHFLIGES